MKRIILCADGTWNSAENISDEVGRPLPTNVLKMARAIKPETKDGVQQVVYYYPGVGTGGLIDKYSGGAFGRGLERNVRDLYRFLVFNYDYGDEVYLFGFSRGAFTIRTLAGFINCVGLLCKQDEYYTQQLYQKCYAVKNKPDAKQWQKERYTIRDDKTDWNISIKLLGVWDTVGALGAPGILGHVFGRRKYRYHDIGLNKLVENAYHAMALDETRKVFTPSLFEEPNDWNGDLQEVWFPGSHSNVGGGHHDDGLANCSLEWMVEKAKRCGLEFIDDYLTFYKGDANSFINKNINFKYRLLGLAERQTRTGDMYFNSILTRMKDAQSHYAPKNVPSPIPESNLVSIKESDF